MNNCLKRLLLAGLVASIGSIASAGEPAVLTDDQLDAVTAGAQYSIVYGAAYAETGTVMVDASARTLSKPNGATMTKAVVKVYADGTGLFALAAGESGAGDQISGSYAQAYSPEGTVMIVIKTKSKINPHGVAMTQSKVKVKATGTGAQTYRATF